MLAVVWSETADEDLAVITNFIGRRNLIAAERLWAKIPVNVCRAVDKLWLDRKSTRLNSSHLRASRMPSSA